MTTTSTASVMLCDVVGSTARRAELGETRADDYFRSLERRLRSVVEDHGGFVVKGAGDGLLATFDSASDAIRSAVDLHRRCRGVEPSVDLRVGVSAGDVTWEDGDCFGMPVVVAARLESACDPGGVLISSIVRILAGDRTGFELLPAGPLDLKGVPEPVDAFHVRWPTEADDVDERPRRFPLALDVGSPHELVGRQAEFDRLRTAWERSRDRPGVALVGGEAGVGKTRLTADFARSAHDEGALVVCGLCDRDLALPYQPWVTIVDALLADPDLPDEVLADLDPLRHLLPGLEHRVGEVWPTGPASADVARHDLLRAVASLVARIAESRQLVVVIDDLHWAGRRTLDLLWHLIRTEPVPGCLVVATFRNTGDEVDDALGRLLADARRVEHVTRLDLTGIDAIAVRRLLDAAGPGDDHDRLAAQIAERTGGNAFLVSELIAHGIRDLEAVPDGVVDVVRRRLDHLAPGARRLADLLAVAGRLDLPVVLALADGLGHPPIEAIGDLVGSGLADELAAATPTYQFTHALVRDAVSAGIGTIERLTAHHAIAGAVERVHETDRRSVLPDLARHYAAAAPITGWEKAAYYGRRAAVQARRTAAYEEAIDLAHLALAVTPTGTDERVRLLLDSVDLHQRCGRNPEALELAEEAADLANDLDDPVLEAAAAIAQERAAHLGNASFERSVRRLHRLVTVDLPTTDRIRVQASLGRARWLSGLAGGPEMIATAVDDARRSGDAETLSHTLEMACVTEADPARALAIAAELESVTNGLDHAFRSMWAMTRQTDALLTLGRLAEATAVLDRLRTTAERYRYTSYRYLTQTFTHSLALAAADFDAAEAAAEAANVTEQREFAELDATGAYGLQMFMVRRAQGRLEEMRPVLSLLAGAEPGVWRPGLVMAQAELGLLDEARIGFAALVADGCGTVPRDTLWPLSLLFLADTCVRLDEADAAPGLLAELEPLRGATIRAGYTTNGGPADRVRAALAELAGDRDAADRAIVDATALADAAGSPLWQAETAATTAWIAARRNEPTADSARALAVGLADRHGIPGVLAHLPAAAEIDLRLPDGLSPREAEVLSTLATGRTNRQIAEVLHISQNTAANHVRAILRKTGCANRTEAAAYAHRHGLATESAAR